jgi:hypothetical protein
MSWCSGRRTPMRQERKILNIYGNKFTGPLGGATSYALERARAPALRIRPPARLVRRKAHTRAHDTHCIKLGTDIGANDKDHASTSQTAHTDRSERQQHQQSLRAHRTRASALASPEPCARNPACVMCRSVVARWIVEDSEPLAAEASPPAHPAAAPSRHHP